MSSAELAVSYAALILADEDIEITVSAVPWISATPTRFRQYLIKRASACQIDNSGGGGNKSASELTVCFLSSPTSSKPSSRPLV